MRKIIKSSNADQTNAFRLHYFPNIPVDGAAGSLTARSTPDATVDESRIRCGIDEPLHGARDAASGQRRNASESQLESMAKRAYAEGFAQGERDARDLAEKRLAPMVAILESTLSELQRVRQKLQRQIEQEVVELALHTARKVVGRELSVSPEAILGVVQEALKQTGNPEIIKVRLNPADLEQIEKLSAQMGRVADHPDRLCFIADNGISGGGCLIETDFGEIDARIEEQFRALEEAFRSELMQPRNE